MRVLLAILLVSCEQAPPSDPPSPAPPPTPITPAPTPIPITPSPPVTPSPSQDLSPTVMLRLTPTKLTANRDHLLDVTPTTAVELDRAAFAALSAFPHDSSTRVIIEADKSQAYANVLALLEAAKRAGYSQIAFSVSPSP